MDRSAQMSFARSYDAYELIADSAERLSSIIQPAQDAFRDTGVVPRWAGYHLLRAWLFHLHRADHWDERQVATSEWEAVLDAIRLRSVSVAQAEQYEKERLWHEHEDAHDQPAPSLDRARLVEATARLTDFLDETPLTARIGGVEKRLEGAVGGEVASILLDAGLTWEVLRATLEVRRALGRMSDVVHAAVILEVLPHILDAGEKIEVKPSLASGVAPNQRFDLETSRRVAEFKVSSWAAGGGNVRRQRATFVDFVKLALEDSGRAKELYVVGDRPADFLRTSAQPLEWALVGAPAPLRNSVEQRYDLTMSVSAFRQEVGGAVRVIDLITLIPGLEQHLA